ncbi:MAG: hypothetical protein A2X94_11580 [Bdellovibrionales bacterium GWB1_55_8]|nr:MAG: hypothetical protein A2X94_11580 [Bdellovibrionales bacterium GWB1_55_8]
MKTTGPFSRITPMLAITIALLLLPGSIPSAQAQTGTPGDIREPSLPQVLKIQRRYQNLLLKIKGAKYVATGTCEERTKELVAGLIIEGPFFDCIAVRLNDIRDLPAVEEIYGNPLRLDGALIHFTDKEPLPNKGGITVHN